MFEISSEMFLKHNAIEADPEVSGFNLCSVYEPTEVECIGICYVLQCSNTLFILDGILFIMILFFRCQPSISNSDFHTIE